MKKKKNATAVVMDGLKRDCEVLALVIKVLQRRCSTSEVLLTLAHQGSHSAENTIFIN